MQESAGRDRVSSGWRAQCELQRKGEETWIELTFLVQKRGTSDLCLRKFLIYS